MKTLAASTDEELLLANTSDAFGEFYDRHARAMMGYFARRTRDPQAAADLTAETFASAIVAQRRFRRGGAPATAWLFAIAARRLVDYQRRGWVDERVRRSLAVEPRSVSEEDAGIIALLADEVTFELLEALPPDQREAVTGHVMQDRGYAELAANGSTSEAVVRQRVSRGLATLRRRLGARG
jgi:RNA polymerase sigma-70 factor (ECF subfamily)